MVTTSAAISSPARDSTLAQSLLDNLEKDGIVRLPDLVSWQTLATMQQAFECRLRQMRWNHFDGYERTERYRFMVQDLLALAQGFVEVALHPLVQSLARTYIGPEYALCEAKGWRSLPTRRDFHGWHGDSWYDQKKVSHFIPRELKLGFYLTDVRSGAFQYIKGSHGRMPPRRWKRQEWANLAMEHMEEVIGPAGSAFLFDTSGIHRQSIPILEPRQAFFLTYHDPAIPLQQDDIKYYRYHPLLLNAAFLGGLSAEDQRVLGFGDKTNYQPNFIRRPHHAWLQKCYEIVFEWKLLAEENSTRVLHRLLRLLGRD